MSVTNNEQYDVVIVGGGMVGASLACALQYSLGEADIKILLVESSEISLQEDPHQPSFDSRSTVLSFGSVEYFRQLGLWQNVSDFAETIKRIHVSDQGKFGAVRMSSEEHKIDALGYVVENKALGMVLNKAILKATRIEICSSAKVSKIESEQDGSKLLIEKSDELASIQSKLVVLAEGGRSGLCEKLGIYRSNNSYEQVAIIANVAFSQQHKNIAYERFTPKGPMALLPLLDIDGLHRAALVWTQSTSDVESVMALDDKQFLDALQIDFGSRLGSFTKVGKRFSYPLSLQQAEEQVRSGLVLLGNVAHSLHPVAGQGFNLALRETMCLAETIVQAFNSGVSLGSLTNLQSYLDKVEQDQDLTIAFSHHMTNLFSSNNEVLVWARKFGLLSVDLVPAFKQGLGRQAMGMAGRRVSL